MRRFVILLQFIFMSVGMFAQQREHVVQRGEDFATIARKYAITEQELMDANPSSKACYVGRKLVIPQHGVAVERKHATPQPLDLKLVSSEESVLTKSAATTYQVGSALWKEGKLDQAFSYLSKAAENGEARAYYPLGECYANKDSKLYDTGKAFECFRKATEQVTDKYDASYWLSCRGMALLYRQGEGVSKNLAKAKKYTDEYQTYTDPDGREEASKLMSAILSEERAIAAQELAEKRERAARLMAEKEAKRRSQAESIRASHANKQGKAQKAGGKSQVAQSGTKSDEEIFPGYTRVAGGVPSVGQTGYWHKSGSLGYCSIRCYQDNEGNVLYSIFPDLPDFVNPSSIYKQNGYRDGWIVFQRVKPVISVRYPTSFLMPYQDMSNSVSCTLQDVPGEFLISSDGKRVQARNGTVYDTPVNKETVNLITDAQNRFVANGIAAGIIQPDYGESDIDRQLREEIQEIDRRQAERRQKEMDNIEKRAELYRGHRTTRYNSTNVESTHTVWCDVCKRFDKPHTHPVNDGRH